MKDEMQVVIHQAKEKEITMGDVIGHQMSPTALINGHKDELPIAYCSSDISPIAERKRMILNPDKDVVDKIISRIFKCNGLCPCQPQDSPEDTRCPCGDFTGRGVCHCKLFIPDPNEEV